MKKILMVCLGNICRSPLAEGLFKHRINELNLSSKFLFDSAGTSNYHIGDLPDHRSARIAKKYGFNINHQARQIDKKDFSIFDEILVMDHKNYEDTYKIINDESLFQKVRLITTYIQRLDRPEIIVDPYWGDLSSFEKVLLQLDECFQGWINSQQDS